MIPADGEHEYSPRIRRERRTVEVMVRMYCAHHHPAGVVVDRDGRASGLCPECAALLEYAWGRVDACRFGEDKPTCDRCTVHCFQAERREQTRTVMRYAGPRMTARHPYLAIRHLLARRAG